MTQVLTHRFAPRGVLKRLFARRDGEVLISGPAGTGKSRACLEKLHAQMLKYPGARGLIVRKTLTSLGSTALVTWREHVVPEALASGLVRFYGGSSEQPPQYVYTNGSVVVIGGMDKAEKIMSSEYDVAYVQEAIELTETDWEAITSRLRNGILPYQQLLADCNPSVPHHWLKKRCDRSDTVMLESRHTDNPRLYTDDGELTEFGRSYLEKLDKLTGVRKLRLRDGRWVAAEGLVYEEWDSAVHLIDRFEIPREWPRFWVVDFGYTNPFTLQWWAEDPDGRVFMYREIYHTQRLVEDHARHALRLVTECVNHCSSDYDEHYCHECDRCVVRWTEPKPDALVCDHDAEGRETLRVHTGISTTAAVKTVTEGIQNVQGRLRRAGDGLPRLFVLRDSLVERDQSLVDAGRPTCLHEEVVGYIWDRAPGKAPKETPVKQDDHGCDTMRYLVAHRDLGSTPGVRFVSW